MNKLLKSSLLLFFFCTCSLSIYSQYNQNTSVYQRKKSPSSSTDSNNNSSNSYNQAGIRTAVYEESEEETTDNPQNNTGRAITTSSSFSTKRVNTSPNGQPISTSSSNRQPISNTSSRNNTSNSNSPYQVKRVTNFNSLPDKKRSGAYSNAKTLNFDVLTEGGRRRSSNSTNTRTATTQRRSTSYYSSYYNDNSVKIYNQKGGRVSANYSNKNRNVIIVPRQGLTVTGIVTSDDPGRTITIKDNKGKSLTYQYTEMDALVNI